MGAVGKAIVSAVVTNGILKIWTTSDRLNPIRFPLHHGTSGLIFTILGMLGSSPTLVGAGITLVIDDLKDFQDWHRLWPHGKSKGIKLQVLKAIPKEPPSIQLKLKRKEESPFFIPSF